jgi:DNA modification methylase
MDRDKKQKANELDGKLWTKYSISVWKDIRKSKEEFKYDHPAMFPVMLIERLIDCFTNKDDKIILDPFMGSGATLVAAINKGKVGIGFEISDYYIKLAEQKLSQRHLFGNSDNYKIFKKDARNLKEDISDNSIDFCVTSPPYWDILSQKRTADYKERRDYEEETCNLSRIKSYEEFLKELTKVFKNIYDVLKPKKYFVLNVMDLRKGNRFYPFHMDVSKCCIEIGFILDDIIIWDRGQEYNNLRPLGYPFVFRINKVHEYLLIFKKK